MTERRIQENIREITQNEDRIGHSQVLLGSSEASQVIADSTITPIADSNNRPGWFLKNTVAGTKFNLYIFGGTQEIIKKSDIRSLYFLGNVDNLNDINSIPYLHIYTKPTGSNDHQVWYHTRYTYKVDLSEVKLGVGEQCLFYANDRPIDKPRKYQSQRHIPMNNSTVDGELDEHGEILYITVSSDTSAVVNTMQCCLQMVGFETIDSFTENEINTPVRNFYFKTPETTQNSDLKARSDIADPNSSTFLNCDTNGHLEVNIIGRDNAGDGSLHNCKVNNDGELFVQNRGVSFHDPLNFNINNGSAHGLVLDDKARLRTATVLQGLTDIADGSTAVNIECDTLGKLSVNDTQLNTKITTGDGVINAGVGLQQVLLYGKKPDGTLQPLETASDRLLVDVVELAASGPISTSTALSSIQMCGIDKVSARFKTLDVNANGELSCINKPFNENTKIFKGGSTLSSQTFNINDVTDSVDLGTKGLTTVSFNIISSSGAGGTGGIILEVSQDGVLFSPTKEFMPDTNASNNHFWYEQNISIPHPFFRFFNNYSQNITVDIAGIVYK